MRLKLEECFTRFNVERDIIDSKQMQENTVMYMHFAWEII